MTGEDELAEQQRKLRAAIRQRDADARSGWDTYAGAIADALKSSNSYEKDMSEWHAWNRNKAFRLIELLHARRPLTDDDYDVWIKYFETTARGPGRERDEAVHDAARLAEALMELRRAERGKVSDGDRALAIAAACKIQNEREGRPVQPERVRDLLSRPKSRRR